MRAKKQQASIKCYCEFKKPIPTLGLILCFVNHWMVDTEISLTNGLGD